MKLTDIFAAFQRKPSLAADPAVNREGARANLTESGPMKRSDPAARRAAMMERLPNPPPLSRDEDIVDISREASFLMAAAQFDPHHMSVNDLADMAGMLRQSGAIGAADHSLLLRGAGGSFDRFADPDQPRDIIADWQMRLSGDMDRPDLRAIGGDTRALNILGRIAAARAQV